MPHCRPSWNLQLLFPLPPPYVPTSSPPPGRPPASPARKANSQVSSPPPAAGGVADGSGNGTGRTARRLVLRRDRPSVGIAVLPALAHPLASRVTVATARRPHRREPLRHGADAAVQPRQRAAPGHLAGKGVPHGDLQGPAQVRKGAQGKRRRVPEGGAHGASRFCPSCAGHHLHRMVRCRVFQVGNASRRVASPEQTCQPRYPVTNFAVPRYAKRCNRALRPFNMHFDRDARGKITFYKRVPQYFQDNFENARKHFGTGSLGQKRKEGNSVEECRNPGFKKGVVLPSDGAPWERAQFSAEDGTGPESPVRRRKIVCWRDDPAADQLRLAADVTEVSAETLSTRTHAAPAD
ncbi:MAG: hypothetical protein BJ554DRAFT_5259 [Olpidium bornovanus]|uniref:Uncharacterized protein n=1 Tax=Olpidium bornovanus TaxID=278681 RepID=A0A8H7ZKX5_9FUNG|nr:MAG: hypothetical protein BJ554DRAFT_5259 [Olpidium bornovanus]